MNKPLLPVVFAGLLALGVSHAFGADDATAYTALRLMGKSLGNDTISHVVEVTGRGGTPQPKAWRIVILDGAKKAREVQVAGGQIVSQKPVVTTAVKPIQLADLNLDSSGAFDAADKEARKAKVPFTAIDYTLRVSATSGKPVWDLELYNADHTRVGGVKLAAHDGNLLAVNGLTPGQQTASARPLNSTHDADHDTVQPTHVSPSGRNTTTTTTTTYNTVRTPPPRERGGGDDDDSSRRSRAPSSDGGGFFSRAGRTLDHTTEAVSETFNHTNDAVGRTARHTTAKVQRFFTGDSNND